MRGLTKVVDALAVDLPDAPVERLEQRPVPALARGERGLGAPRVGHVPPEAEQPVHLARLVADRDEARRPDARARRERQLLDVLGDLAGLRGAAQALLDHVAHLLRQVLGGRPADERAAGQGRSGARRPR